MPPHTQRPAETDPARQTAGDWRRWLRADFVLLALGLVFLLWFLGDVLLLVFAGILLAVAIDGLAQLVAARTPLSRGWAVLPVVVLLALLLVLAGFLVVPQFLEQIGGVWDQLSQLAGDAQQVLQQFPWLQEMLGMGGENGEGEENGQGIAGQLASATMTLLGGLMTVVIVVVLGVFMAADPGLYRRGLVRLVPQRFRPRAEETLSTLGYALRWWLLGQLVSMLVLGVSTSLGLLVLGIDLWLGLGVLVALFTFIPFLGPIIAGIPVVVVGFADGMQTGLIVLAFYLVLQNVEGNVLTPMIQQRAISLPPALLISTQLLFGTLFGAVGLILAAPFAVVAMVLVNLLYIEEVLGEPRANP